MACIKFRFLSSPQVGQFVGKEVANALDGHVRRRIGGEHLRVVRELALAWKHRSDALAPRLLRRRKDAQLHQALCRDNGSRSPP